MHKLRQTVVPTTVVICMALGREYLAEHGSVKSRHDFTQPQLMTCLVLRTYWKTTYRGVIEQMAVSAEMREAIRFTKKLPNYSTLKKFADRPSVPEAMHAMIGTLAKLADEANGKPLRRLA